MWVLWFIPRQLRHGALAVGIFSVLVFIETVLGLRRRWLSLMVFAGVEIPAFLLHSVGIPAVVEQPQIKEVNFWSPMENSMGSRSNPTVLPKA